MLFNECGKIIAFLVRMFRNMGQKTIFVHRCVFSHLFTLYVTYGEFKEERVNKTLPRPVSPANAKKAFLHCETNLSHNAYEKNMCVCVCVWFFPL